MTTTAITNVKSKIIAEPNSNPISATRRFVSGGDQMRVSAPRQQAMPGR